MGWSAMYFIHPSWLQKTKIAPTTTGMSLLDQSGLLLLGATAVQHGQLQTQHAGRWLGGPGEVEIFRISWVLSHTPLLYLPVNSFKKFQDSEHCCK